MLMVSGRETDEEVNDSIEKKTDFGYFWWGVFELTLFYEQQTACVLLPKEYLMGRLIGDGETLFLFTSTR